MDDPGARDTLPLVSPRLGAMLLQRSADLGCERAQHVIECLQHQGLWESVAPVSGSTPPKNAFFCIFSSLLPCFESLKQYFCGKFQKSTIMQDSKLSLVMDTIGIIGMFFVAALLLCV
jgi:hypothetical protein